MTDPPEISRRDLLRGRFFAGRDVGGAEPSAPAAAAPVGPVPMVMRYPRSGDEVTRVYTQSTASPALRRRAAIPVLRPPGAIDEASFLNRCTRCEACISACPYDAIRQAPLRLREAAGTPIIDPDLAACQMCADAPCIAACQPGALSPHVPRMMGTARVTAQTCLAHQGTTCMACAERCPVPGAIELTDGKPQVHEDICTGCGVCRYVCPSPENAILLMPTFARPAPPGGPGAPVDPPHPLPRTNAES